MDASDEGHSRQTAIDWFTRLQNRSVTTADLNEFAAWRRDASNAEAYREVESLWADSARLGSDPDILHAVKEATQRADRQTSPRGGTRKTVFVLLSALAALLAFGFFSIGAFLPQTTISTAVGETSVAKLDDGSRVQLDTDSVLAAEFRKDVRKVRLERGQAFFHVSHDASRPFIVDVGNGATVTALGTSFDVRRASGRTFVYLSTGSVQIRRDGDTLATLLPGQRAEFGHSGPASVVARPPGSMSTWRERRLSFEETPLSEAVAEMNRYSDTPIVLNGGLTGRALMNGEFSVDDPRGFVGAVNALFGAGAAAIPTTHK